MMLSYPFAWMPVAFVVATLALLNAWLMLIGLALVAFLAFALVVGLAWAAVAGLHALGRRSRLWRGLGPHSGVRALGRE